MRKLIYPLLFFSLTVFGFFWYLQPTYADIQTLQEEIGKYDTALSQVNELQTELNSQLTKRDGITDSQRSRLDRVLPETVDTVRFLIELDQIAAQHGMSVDGVSFSGAPERFGGPGNGDEADYNSLQASFEVTGSYTAVQNFMRDIEQSSRLMDITKFALTVPESDSGQAEESEDDLGISTGQNEYEFTLRTYWRNRSSS